jgi:DnaD/phage-associated family protein
MSIAEMSRVFKVNLKKVKSGKLVLLAIADNADDDGYAFPGVKTIADKSDMTERNAKRVIHNLAEAGQLYIATGRGRGNTNAYVIVALLTRHQIVQRLVTALEMTMEQATATALEILAKRDKLSSLKKVTKTTEKVTKSAIKHDIAMSPESSLTIIEPSEKAAAPQTPQYPGESRDNGANKKAAAAAYDAQTERYALAFKAYEECFGLTVNPTHADHIRAYIDDDHMPVEWIVDAFQEAVDHDARKWTYVRAILENWRRNGRGRPQPTKENPAGWTWGHEAYKLVVPGLHPNVIIRKAQRDIVEALEKAWHNEQCRKLLIEAGLGDKMTAKFGGVA